MVCILVVFDVSKPAPGTESAGRNLLSALFCMERTCGGGEPRRGRPAASNVLMTQVKTGK